LYEDQRLQIAFLHVTENQSLRSKSFIKTGSTHQEILLSRFSFFSNAQKISLHT
jgi:hypothetical protein